MERLVKYRHHQFLRDPSLGLMIVLRFRSSSSSMKCGSMAFYKRVVRASCFSYFLSCGLLWARWCLECFPLPGRLKRGKQRAINGQEPVRWFTPSQIRKTILIAANVWKWAATAACLPCGDYNSTENLLFEAAGRRGFHAQQILHLTVPMLKPTAVVLTLQA